MTYSEDGRRQIPGDRFDDVREILELRDRGWTLGRISDKVGVARSTVYRVTESTEWYANRTEIELTEGKT
jgi:orotate phosphoribosyltransferase-like protein